MDSDQDHDNLNPSNVPAFAVYKNLIPGLKSYEDTSIRSRKKKNRKRKSKGEGVDIKEEVNLSPSKKKVAYVKYETCSSSEPKKRKRKNKKRKLSESGAVLNADEEATNNDASLSTSSFFEVHTLAETKTKKKKRLKIIDTSSDVQDLAKTKTRVDNTKEELPHMNGIVLKKNKQKQASISQAVPPPKRTSLRSIELMFDSSPVYDSALHGKDVFEWLIHPMTTEKFFAEHWEKKPLHLKRTNKHDLFKWLLTSSTLDDVMRKNNIKFGKNIDITSYINGERQTHNPADGTRALPAVVWDYFSNGNSVRFLNPQTYIKPIWRMNAALQEYLGTFVGCNAYLTPADSQGFAPHFDDIEAFILQVEGYKHWKLYKPRKKSEQLPRFSSQNFDEVKDKLGQPILDVVLGPGDFLYFPRGIIHQAKCTDEHSLHLTISAYQTNTYGDLLTTYFPIALEQAMTNNLELRRGLPIDYLSYMGIVHQDQTDKNIVQQRTEFQKKIKKLAEGILTQSCDLAADQLGKKLVWDSLPPFLTSKEKRRTVIGDGEFIQEGTVLNRVEMGPDVEVKLVRRHACRLVLEEGTLRLYFNVQNSMEYHGEEPAYLELPDDAGPAIEFLFVSYPEFVSVDQIPVEDQDLKIQICADLWEKGIILTKNPLSTYPFDEDLGSEDEEMEEPADSTSSEEVSAEEEEDDEDKAFIDDQDEEGDSEGYEDEINGDMPSFINDVGSDEEEDDDVDDEGDEDDDDEEDDDEETPPRLVKAKQVVKSRNFIL